MKKTHKIIAAAGAFLIVGIIIVLTVFITNNNRQKDDTGSGVSLTVSKDAKKWDQPLEDKSEGAKGVKIPGYEQLVIGSSDSTLQAALLNPEGNPCYFAFTIKVDETEKTLCESELVEPGKALEDTPAENVPPAGDYNLTIYIKTYSLEDKSPMNSAQVHTTLHVI